MVEPFCLQPSEQTIQLWLDRCEKRKRFAFCPTIFASALERKEILKQQQEFLVKKMENLQEDIAYIDWKQSYYDDVLSGKNQYTSNLIGTDEG